MTENIISERKVTSAAKTEIRKPNEKALMLDPAYKEQLKRFLAIICGEHKEAVHCADGTIILMEDKTVMTAYVWDPKKREFVRKKQQAIAKSDNCST